MQTINGVMKIGIDGLSGFGPFSEVTCWSAGEEVLLLSATDDSGRLSKMGIAVNTKSKQVDALGLTTAKGFSIEAFAPTTKMTIKGNQITITGTGKGKDEAGKSFTSRKFSVDVTCK